MYVLGTAGHIDHGKSSIIKRLSGIDPDRLPEEKARGLTIDLGFAWMRLPSGSRVGFVDVPGHEKFVKNMIAGVGSIDAALLVIAADDGWMPQTEEHLQILELLGVKSGLVLLNKIDAVDPDWGELVAADIEERIENRSIEFKGVIPVSAITGDGFDRLIESLEQLLSETVPRADVEKPRLYADRAFTITGMGTVLTGTLTGGKLSVGDEVTIYPVSEKARIRNLQSYKESLKTATQGNRVAANVTGSEKRNLHRGIMISGLNDLRTADFLNCYFKVPPTGKIPLKHNSQVVVLLGTAEVLSKVLLFEDKMFKPGEEGFCRIKLSEPVCPFLGDRLIARQPSPATTIGGGVILDFQLTRRIKTGSKELDYIRSLHPISPENIINATLEFKGYWDDDDRNYVRNSVYSEDEFQQVLNRLVESGVVEESNRIYFAEDFVERIEKETTRILEKHHNESPWTQGIGAKELTNSIGIPDQSVGDAALELLTTRGKVQYSQGVYSLSKHSASLPDPLERLAAEIETMFKEKPWEAPTKSELEKQSKDRQVVLNYLLKSGILIDCGGGIILHSDVFDKSKQIVIDYLKANGKAKSSELRKALNTSRKYAIPFLEKLDRDRITSFDGEFRTLANGS
ncbi:MAG: selenocysteine-specific translation elongation factor [candidate division Zixibacteria bacterium]|nr:selenocysteine-specific translation elongation factor [candidate division Zixibacteria bacterium]